MTDDEIIDVEPGQEMVVAGGAPPATLFRTDDPVEIVARATSVATILSGVLKKQGLTKRISNKDYVQVEGWTLCGTMLGVYPVVEWTRPIEGGWEARVEARTRDGAVVGAAEAECLRSESRWKSADDYSIRSMAQTRAISKALRAPLGFIVALAGYEVTPASEIPDEPTAAREFDPDHDLMPGAIHGPDALKLLGDALNGFDPTMDWHAVLDSVAQSKYGKQSWRELEGDPYADFLRRLSNAVQWITNHTPAGDFPPVDAERIGQGFIFAFAPLVFEAVYKEAEAAPLTPEQVAAAEEAMAAEDIPFPES